MNKKIIFIITSLMCVFVNLYAQVSLNPNDDFYKDAKNWETKGIVSWLPQIRPYSINTVKKILAENEKTGLQPDIYTMGPLIHNPGVLKSLEEQGVIKKTLVSAPSGFCIYPLYEFSQEWLDKLSDIH